MPATTPTGDVYLWRLSSLTSPYHHTAATDTKSAAAEMVRDDQEV